MLAVYAAAALAIALIGARYLKSTTAEVARPAAAAEAAFSRAAGDPSLAGGSNAAGASRRMAALVVHVAGAVRRPGVVRVKDGSRIGDAIRAAGGPARGANLDAVNLALQLADGQQIVVPGRDAIAGAGGASGPVSLNTATPEQLDALDGVGPGLAEKIVAYRMQHGGFRSVDELGEVPGIGDKRMESLRGQLQP